MYGIFNQKGFILPITLMVCLLFPVVILAQVEMYKTELRFYVELEEIEHLNSLTQMGIRDLYKQTIENSLSETKSGMLFYPNGTINYRLEPSGEVVIIQGNCITLKKRKHFFQATVNKETNEIEMWVEE